MFQIAIVLAVLALIFTAISFAPWPMPYRPAGSLKPAHNPTKRGLRYAATGVAIASLLSLLAASFAVVPPSNEAVQVRLGKVLPETLTEGLHLVPPWVKVVNVYMAQQSITSNNADAASQDVQKVTANVNVAYVIKPGKARDLYVMNPTLSYANLLADPAIKEVFKAIIAQYTAEQLVTQRQTVSAAITTAIQTKLSPFHLHVQAVNLMNFGFSKQFDESIEEKVVASQKSETAKRNLERVKYEAESRIAQAEGEAKAIAIQAAAVEKQGGDKYVQLQAIDRWDGKLPTTMAGTVPFVNVKP